MSDYVKTTDFTAKDALNTGDPLKLIKGSYFDTEFDALAVASATKEDASNKSSAGGYAGLNGSSLINDGELPSAGEALRGVAEVATDAEVCFQMSKNHIKYFMNLLLTLKLRVLNLMERIVTGKNWWKNMRIN